MKILIADDDRTSRLMMRSMLVGSGYEVVIAEDGTEAVARLMEPDAPRLALLDWMMPGLNGPQVCRNIRAIEGRPYTYLLLLTARDSKEDLVAGLQAGADDYVTKPCYPEELRARLRTGVRILRLEDSLIQAREEMRYQATHDALTHLLNRGAAVHALESALHRAAAEGESITVALGDIDHFKRINDTYGHPAGDEVLREVARRLTATVRVDTPEQQSDVIGRFGGEEFLLVLRGHGPDDGAQRAEAIRRSIAESPVLLQSQALPVTMSLGALTVAPSSVRDVDEALRRADELLYEAKRMGRNRTISAVEGEARLSRVTTAA